MEDHAMRALVRGRVQGVGFRAFAQHEAERLGLRGYARNLYDGRVEVVAVGPQDNLDRLAARLKTGPPGSRVEGLDRTAMDPPPEVDRFEIRPTALGSPGGRGAKEKP
jgi:acylphosphatase